MCHLEVINSLEDFVFEFICELLDTKKKRILQKNKIIETTRLMYIIEIILNNLNQNNHTTLRQVFYTNPKLFINQNISNRIIGKLTKIIQKPRELLNIYNAPKGIIRGNVFLKESNSNQWIDCMDSFEVRGHLICPFGITDLIIPESVKYVLIIEKETIFFKLLDTNFINTYGPCILITAKGFPDINTRQLIYQIQRKNSNLRLFCLTDYDAYGLNIAFTYSSKYESKVYYVEDMMIENLYWLNLVVPDEAVKKSILRPLDLSSLTLKDLTLLENICQKLNKTKTMNSAEKTRWIGYVKNMKKFGVKYEIDAITDIEKQIFTTIQELISVE